MASIVQRSNRYNVVYLYDDEATGKRKQKWESFSTLEDAKRRKAEVEYRQVHQGQAERQQHDEQKHHAVEPEEGVFPQHQRVWHKKQGKHNGRFQYIGKHRRCVMGC